MVEINTKRVYEDYDESDGFRVLVDRLWPRGMKKEELKYDLWAKGVAPSTGLREWFHADPDNRWEEFSKQYEKELAASDAVKDFIGQIKDKKKVTLLYAAKDEKHNNVLILRDYLEKALK